MPNQLLYSDGLEPLHPRLTARSRLEMHGHGAAKWILTALAFAWLASGCNAVQGSAAQNPAAKNLIAVPVDPQLSGDGRLIVAGIQLRNRMHYTDANGSKDYVDNLVGNEVRFWDAQTLAPRPALPVPSTPGDVAVSPDGALVALSGTGEAFRVVDVASQKTLWSQSEAASTNVQPEAGFVTVLAPHGLSGPAFSPDSRTIAAWSTFIDEESGGKQVTGHLFDARTGTQKASWKVSPEAWISYMALRFSPDGRFLAATGPMPRMYSKETASARPEIRDARSGELLRTLPFNGARIQAFGPDNRVLITLDSSQYGSDAVEVNALTGKRLWSHSGTVTYAGNELVTIESAFYSADKKRLAVTFRASKSVEILDARDGKIQHLIQVSAAPNGPYAGDGAFAFSPDGRELLCMEQGSIRRQPIQ